MDWIRVRFSVAGEAFQEVANGRVLRYVDRFGAERFVEPPVGDSCSVIEAVATPTAAMIAAATTRYALFDPSRGRDRRVVRRRSTDA